MPFFLQYGTISLKLLLAMTSLRYLATAMQARSPSPIKGLIFLISAYSRLISIFPSGNAASFIFFTLPSNWSRTCRRERILAISPYTIFRIITWCGLKMTGRYNISPQAIKCEITSASINMSFRFLFIINPMIKICQIDSYVLQQ